MNDTVTAQGDPRTMWTTRHARVSHEFDLSTSTYLKPIVDVGVQYSHQESYTETGAGDFGLVVDEMSSTFLTLNPKMELGTDFKMNGIPARASINAGVLAVVAGNRQSTDVRFVGAGADGPDFSVANEGSDFSADLSAGLISQVSERTTIRTALCTLLGDSQ